MSHFSGILQTVAESVFLRKKRTSSPTHHQRERVALYLSNIKLRFYQTMIIVKASLKNLHLRNMTNAYETKTRNNPRTAHATETCVLTLACLCSSKGPAISQSKCSCSHRSLSPTNDMIKKNNTIFRVMDIFMVNIFVSVFSMNRSKTSAF